MCRRVFAMSEYDKAQQRIQAKREAKKAERLARDEKEMVEHIEPLLEAHEDYEVVRVPEADKEFVGHVVIRPPEDGEMKRFKHVIFNDKAKGAIEAKAKSTAELGASCVKYPDKERYDALVLRYPGVADIVGSRAVDLARAGAELEGKG